MEPYIPVIIVGVLAALVIFSNLKIVPQANQFIIERLGKYKKTWEAGLHFTIPFIDRIAKRVTLKEQVLDTPPQPVITKDNVTMQIDTVVYYRVFDAKLYTYGAQDPVFALGNLTTTTLRNIIGALDLDATLTSRDQINGEMTSILDEATDQWGIKVSRVELKNIMPPQEIREAMEKQMKAERDRRETLLQADGHKLAAIARAEGDKQEAIARSAGETARRVNEAEGKAREITLVAEATAAGLRTIAEATQQPGGRDAVNLRLAEGYIGEFGKLAKAGNTLIIPTDLANVAGFIKAASSVIDTAKAK